MVGSYTPTTGSEKVGGQSLAGHSGSPVCTRWHALTDHSSGVVSRPNNSWVGGYIPTVYSCLSVSSQFYMLLSYTGVLGLVDSGQIRGTGMGRTACGAKLLSAGWQSSVFSTTGDG